MHVSGPQQLAADRSCSCECGQSVDCASPSISSDICVVKPCKLDGNHTSVTCIRDARPGRTEWLAANPQQPPMSKKTRRMKNPERLAQSKKKPLKARYISGNTRIQMYREE